LEYEYLKQNEETNTDTILIRIKMKINSRKDASQKN